jgi:hypothetical protein
LAAGRELVLAVDVGQVGNARTGLRSERASSAPASPG